MAKVKTSPRKPSAASRQRNRQRARAPRRSWLQRYGIWIALAAVLIAGGGVLLASVGGDDAAEGGLTGPDFHSLVVDPTNPRRVFVGGHYNVSVSVNGGRTWREVDSLQDADAMGWAFTDDAIYVSGHPGLNRSTDGGRTFERINQGLPNTDVHAFGAGDGVLYGSTPVTGVFASTNGGDTWQSRTDSVGQGLFGRIVVDPANPDHLFAADASAGVGESTDGGRTWTRLDIGLPAATWMSRGGDGLELLVASGPEGVAHSTDGGSTWEPLDVPEGASLVEAVPGDANLLYAGSHEGERVQVVVSRDAGATWSAR